MAARAGAEVRVWDGWVRLFHWAIVLLLGLSYWSIQTGRMQLHYWSGYTVLTLVLFRIGWGFVGSDTARFARFLRGPGAALEHLRHIARREPDTEVTYKVSDTYAPDCDRGLAWDDPALGIDWGVAPGQAVLSDKDRRWPGLAGLGRVF